MLKKILWLVIMVPALARADATVKYQGSSPDGTLSTTIYVTGDHLRVETTGSSRPVVVLYDPASDETIMLDQQKKQYMKLSQVMQQAEAASDMMQKALKNVPPEQRAMMSKMMGQFGKRFESMMKQPKPAVTTRSTFVKTGKKDTASGVSCEWVRRKPANAQQSEFCLADYGDLGLSKADYATVRAFMAKSKKMAASAARMSGGLIKPDQMFDGDIDGLPVKTRDNAGRQMKLISKASGANPPGGFAVPAGYSPMAIPQMPR